MLESLGYLESKIWGPLSLGFKQSESLSEFKSKISKWNLQSCPVKLCKTYKILV